MDLKRYDFEGCGGFESADGVYVRYSDVKELQSITVKLAERDALLRNIRTLVFDEGAILYSDAPGFIADIRDLLSASAEPSGPKCETCNDHGEIGCLRPDGYDSEPCPECAVPSAPVERDELLREVLELIDDGVGRSDFEWKLIQKLRTALSASVEPVYWNKDSQGNATDVPNVEPRQLDNLRHIRLHHWKVAESHRRMANDISGRYVGNADDAKAIDFHRELSNYHRTIVHSLNDFFPAGDTADKGDV